MGCVDVGGWVCWLGVEGLVGCDEGVGVGWSVLCIWQVYKGCFSFSFTRRNILSDVCVCVCVCVYCWVVGVWGVWMWVGGRVG